RAEADPVADQHYCGCSGSDFDFADCGLFLRAVEWIEGQPDGRGSRCHGAAPGIVGAGWSDRSAHAREGWREAAAVAACLGGCPGDLGVDYKADFGDYLRHRYR